MAPLPSPRPFFPSSFAGNEDERNPAGSITNFNGGNKIFISERTGLSIPAGEELDIPMTLNLSSYSQYYLYYIIDQDILVTVEWLNSTGDTVILEKVVPFSASYPDGAMIEGRVQARTVRIRIKNNAVPGISSDITEAYISLFGVR